MLIGVSQRLNNTISDVDELKLKVMELEKELEIRDQEIAQLLKWGLILSLLLLVSMILAAAGLSRASKARKAIALLTGGE